MNKCSSELFITGDRTDGIVGGLIGYLLSIAKQEKKCRFFNIEDENNPNFFLLLPGGRRANHDDCNEIVRTNYFLEAITHGFRVASAKQPEITMCYVKELTSTIKGNLLITAIHLDLGHLLLNPISSEV